MFILILITCQTNFHIHDITNRRKNYVMFLVVYFFSIPGGNSITLACGGGLATTEKKLLINIPSSYVYKC